MAIISTPMPRKLLSDLRQAGAQAVASTLGDSFLLPHEFADASQSMVAAQFGPDFAKPLADLKTGEWTGPIRSDTVRIRAAQPRAPKAACPRSMKFMILFGATSWANAALRQPPVSRRPPRAIQSEDRMAEGGFRECGKRNSQSPMNRLLLILAVCGAFAFTANAHEVRPAYLELRQTAPDTYDILWKVPARAGNERLGIYVHLPNDVRQSRNRTASPPALPGSNAGASSASADSPARPSASTVSWPPAAMCWSASKHGDGSTQTTRLLPSRPSFVVEALANPWRLASTYLALGVEHILGGIDHLLFVLALLFGGEGLETAHRHHHRIYRRP